jgi:hypothetical protein
MIRNCIILLFIFILVEGTAQFKTVRFITMDRSTEKPIGGVTVSPMFTNDSVISNKKGIILMEVPRKYEDSLTFSKADYFPYTTKITTVLPGKAKAIFMTSRLNASDTSYSLNSKDNKQVVGQVYHANLKEPIVRATIKMDNGLVVGNSNEKGNYEIFISKSNDSLIINYPGFQTKKIAVKRNMNTSLMPNDFIEQDIFKEQYKNTLSFSILELFRGAITLRYERFIQTRHSVGLHNSVYFFNKEVHTELFIFENVLDISEFDGVKMAPFYRFYLMRVLHGGVYADAKPIIGYFKFPELNYSGYTKEEPTEFWSFGAGLALGFMINVKNFLMNISLGAQYFPMNAPDTYKSYELDDQWWYAYGPGAYFDFKITVGGIF